MTKHRNTPKSMIYQEHDGTWTWSIEIGEPFEDGYRVIDRNDGYLTRNDAKEAMVEAMAHHQADLAKKPSVLESSPSRSEPRAKAAPEPVNLKITKPIISTGGAIFSDALPEWAVVVDDRIVALFVDRTQATAFGNKSYRGKHTIRRVIYKITLTTSDET
jgi:hypothetical protein